MPADTADEAVHFVMPSESQARDIPEGYFQEGEAVVYHSRTHHGFLRTRIAKVHAVGGVVQAIDLACKKSADLAKIAKIQSGEVVDSVEADNVSRKHRGNVLTELPSPLYMENAERWPPETRGGDGILCYDSEAGKPQKLATATEIRRENNEVALPGPERFKIGEKVFYNSKTLRQRVVAIVKGITADGLYDLDVKSRALPENVSRYVEEAIPAPPAPPAPSASGAVAPPPATYSGLPPTFPGDQASSGLPPVGDRDAPRQATRVVLPLQKVYMANDGFAATDCSGATPLGFQMPPTAFSTPSGRYGEGQVVSCKVSAAVPLGPRPPTPDRTPGRAASPASFFPPGGMTPKATTSQTPAQAAAAAELVASLRGEIRVTGSFEPRQPEIRAQLAQQLSLGGRAQIQAMSGFKGGLNLGIWLVSGGAELVLKQVRCARVASNVLTEAENFIRVVKEHPEITQDPVVAFPVKILSCVGADRRPVSDVIVMKKSRGERLCEYVATKFYANQVPQLCAAMEAVGRALRRFHERYGNQQHGDFQPSNIYYDESTASVSFIDVGGMGVPTTGNDLEHFHQCMRSMTTGYQPHLHVDLLNSFDKGYQSSPSHQGFEVVT